jgi:hypothetical protein
MNAFCLAHPAEDRVEATHLVIQLPSRNTVAFCEAHARTYEGLPEMYEIEPILTDADGWVR